MSEVVQFKRKADAVIEAAEEFETYSMVAWSWSRRTGHDHRN